MIWEQYEVWAVSDDGFEELIESTKSLGEAKKIAKALIEQDYVAADVYKEDEEGELELIESFDKD
jgi:hypothetical protein